MKERNTTPERGSQNAPRSIALRDRVSNIQVSSASGVVITHEDIDRAHDREQVSATRARRGFRPRLRLFWLLIGPGILVMLGENDGPSMLSYAATGARFGVGFFVPFVVLTFLMACVVQEMTVRLGAATHRGHAELIFDRFGPFWGWFSMIDLMVGNFLTLVTEFIAIRAGLGFFGIRPAVAVLSALLVLSVALMTHRYWTWERIILGAAIFNLVFVPVALLAHPHWHDVARSLLTWKPLPGGLTQETVLILLANIGATVTPWMLFFQQSAIADKGLTTHDIRMSRVDTGLGALLATTAALATMLATAPLFVHHMAAANFEAAEFAQALQPFVGHWGAALFALGIFEAGMVAAITISTSSAYAFGEVARRPHSLNLPFNEGKAFYLVLLLEAAAAGGLVLIPGIPLVYIVLLVNVIAVLAMPPALLFLYMLVNDREIMGNLVSPLWANVLALGVVIILIAAGLLFGISVIAPNALAMIGAK
ncbi:MAG TPA: NRAMP family divalent metal transporter [Terriglobales bacterium]|jgi:Mn2+/Fe2+ NRAMP family transporter|nr:NRAMP family divalent metal transporter [Terriglobales bacterium]